MDHGLDHRSDYGSDQEKALVHSSGHIKSNVTPHLRSSPESS